MSTPRGSPLWECTGRASGSDGDIISFVFVSPSLVQATVRGELLCFRFPSLRRRVAPQAAPGEVSVVPVSFRDLLPRIQGGEIQRTISLAYTNPRPDGSARETKEP